MAPFGGTRLLAASNVGTLVLGLISAPLVARGLGVSARGEYGILIALGPALAIVCGFGVSWAARTALSAGDSSATDVLDATRIAALFLMLLGLPVGATVGGALSPEPGVILATALYISACFGAVLRTTYGSVLLFRGSLARLALYAAMPTLVAVGTVVVASAFGRLSLSVAILGTWAGLVSQNLFIPRRRRSRPLNVRFRGLALRGARVWPLQVAEQLYLRSDVLLVFVLCGPHAAGLYAVPAIGTQVTYGLMTAMNAPMYRVASDLDLFRSFLRDNLRSTLALSLTIWPVAWVAAPWAVPVIFGEEFESAAALMPLGGAMSLAMVAWLPAIHASVLRDQMSTALRWCFLAVPGCAGIVGYLAGATEPALVVIVLACCQLLAGATALIGYERVRAWALVPRFDLLWRFFF